MYLRNANKSMRVTFALNSVLHPTKSVGVRSSDLGSKVPTPLGTSLFPPRKCSRPATLWWVGSSDPTPHTQRRFCVPSDKGFSGKNSVTRQKFRPYVESSDKHIKRPVTTTFWGSGINTPHPLIHLLLSPRDEHLLNLPKLLPIPYKS